MAEFEIVRIRRKNHEAFASSRRRLLICMAISLAFWAVIILASFATS